MSDFIVEDQYLKDDKEAAQEMTLPDCTSKGIKMVLQVDVKAAKCKKS